MHINIYIYPVFILLLPVGMIDSLVMLLSFFYGLTIDMFFNTTGLFASAAVLVAAARPLVLEFLTPRGGYETGKSPTKYSLGNRWFVQYSAYLMLIHTIWVTSLEDLNLFALDWWFELIMTFLLSLLVVILYQHLFNPKE